MGHRQAVMGWAFAMSIAAAAWSPLQAQTQKGTLIFAVESLAAQTMDPILEARPGNATYQAAMYDALIGFNIEKGGTGPGVAERWELSEDGLTWTFHIRPGQKFHNGDPLTAHDAQFSLRRQMAPNSLASAAASFRRTIKSIDVSDDLTFRVTTVTPQIGLPALLSRAVAAEGAIMPKAYIERVGEEEFRRKPVGSGPWRFTRSVPGDRIEFEAVAGPHWRGTPHFKELHILLVPEESTRVAMTRTGEAGIASIGPESMIGAARGGLEVLSVPGTMQALFQFWGSYLPAFKDSPVANPRVRRALSLAIDRQQIIDHVMNGKASMPYPFDAFGYTEYFDAAKWRKWSDDAFRYDPVLAKKILTEEGYPNGFELNFANTALPGTQFMVDIGTAVADMWTKIGVRVKLRHYEWGSFAPLVRGDQALLAGGASMYRTVGRPDMPWRFEASFAADSEQHLIGDKTICEAACQAFAAVYKDLLAERDPVKRTALTDRMVELVSETWTAVPIIEGMGYYAINARKAGKFTAIPGRHELGDVFERIPRPDEAPWKK
ncbi:MAG: ABC transporter substrate-binding protein [Acetobacteraceae bacterium]|nr:ABC transporter substrate-binding protein [Acetobacteraceae bacterium]